MHWSINYQKRTITADSEEAAADALKVIQRNLELRLIKSAEFQTVIRADFKPFDAKAAG